jgi:hypothetical protein
MTSDETPVAWLAALHVARKRSGLRIGIVGGVERYEPAYEAIAKRNGHEVVFHSGDVGGRGSDALARLVSRVDIVIVITDVNSHGAVGVARWTAARLGTRVALQRRYSPARLEALLATVDMLGLSLSA